MACILNNVTHKLAVNVGNFIEVSQREMATKYRFLMWFAHP